MKFAGLWSLGSGNGKRSFTGTSLTVPGDQANIDFSPGDNIYFTGQIQNLSPDTDVIIKLQSKGAVSQVNYTLHAREYINCKNIPLEKIFVMLNGTAVLQGLGFFSQLSSADLAGLTAAGGLNIIQDAQIEIGRISESSSGSAPTWQGSAKSNNPAAGSTLSSKTVGTGRGYIMGIYITAPEANTFELEWTSSSAAKEKLYVIGSATGGTLIFTDAIAINSGQPADAASSILLKNTNAGVGDYQADILYSEVFA